MAMTAAQKAWIDSASYEALLRRWRTAPAGDPMFLGECGTYYAEQMRERRKAVGDDEHVRASKAIGWER